VAEGKVALDDISAADLPTVKAGDKKAARDEWTETFSADKTKAELHRERFHL